MSTFITETSEQMARGVAATTEEIIRQAVILHTGDSDVVLTDLTKRCKIMINSDSTEVFYLDGVPLVCFWPLRVETTYGDGSAVMTVSRSYQILVNGGEA